LHDLLALEDTEATMNLPSIWLSEAGVNVSRAAAKFPKLTGKSHHYDVAIIGGGIFGCTTAHLLKSSGKKVAILEARSIGNGVTAFSTAKLSAQQGPVYSTIAQARGNTLARAYYDMNIAAIAYADELSSTAISSVGTMQPGRPMNASAR
jgi:hypothetical protein